MSVWKTTAVPASNPLSRGILAALLCVWLPSSGGKAQEASTAEPTPAAGAPAAEATPAASMAEVVKDESDGAQGDGAQGDGAQGASTAEAGALPQGASTPEAEAGALPEGAEAPGDDGAGEDAALNLQTADQEYHLKLNQLEGKISDLKDQIFRSKAKLQMLTEEVTGGLGIGSGLVIVHYNDMSAGFFQLIEAHYFLDGKELWQEVDDSGELLTEKRERNVLEGPMVEGSHTLTVNLVYRGNGNGLFSYLKGYTWRLKDSYTFTVEPGKQVFIQVHGFEQGNFTTELKDRPAIRFDTEIKDIAN